MTFQEIGDAHGVSKERASLLVKRVYRELLMARSVQHTSAYASEPECAGA